MSHALRSVAALALGASIVTGLVAAQGSSTPITPRPFPGAAPATPAAPRPAQPTPATPAPAPLAIPQEAAPAEGVLAGAPVYPGAEFLESLDAGRGGQRYYLYGTNVDYAQIVNYYRNTIRNGGRELYRAPAMHQFDIGRFDDNAMAYPPSVVVKDYSGPNGGYLFAAGTVEKRFRTIIQIVPPTPAR